MKDKAKVRKVERLFTVDYKQNHLTETKKQLYRSLEFRMPEALVPHAKYIAHVTDFPFLNKPAIISAANLLSLSNETPVTPQNTRTTYGITTTRWKGSMSVFEYNQDFVSSDLTGIEQHFNLPEVPATKEKL